MDRSLLTQRFWRADHKRSDSAGIGLSIVQRIVDLHDGHLDIGDGPGGGARFAMVIPLAAG
jgi:signal transduction histidine kinase